MNRRTRLFVFALQLASTASGGQQPATAPRALLALRMPTTSGRSSERAGRSTPYPCACVGYFNDAGELVTDGLPPALIVMGTRISDYYGFRLHPILNVWMLHEGVDIASAEGSPVFAIANGVVEAAAFMGDFGNLIRIRHSRNYETAYAHASRFADGIRPGARVKRGQVIGLTGHSGLATGSHLHLEILVHGKRMEPACSCDQRPPENVTQLADASPKRGTAPVFTTPATDDVSRPHGKTMFVAERRH